MIPRADGKVLANKYTVIDGVTDRVTYEPVSDDPRSYPWDPDRERYLKSGETFLRLNCHGCPTLFERVWVKL